MYKDDKYADLNKLYNNHLYSGLNGIFMRYCHRKLENYSKDIVTKKILEVGAGTAPHIDYIKCNYEEYKILEISEYSKKFIKDKYGINVDLYDGTKLPYENNKFDRVIISHCLEHIKDPEKFIEELMSKLKKGGFLSVSLPTDPGFMWRLGRKIVKKFVNTKTYKLNDEEYEYLNSIEHVNSIFNLISIIRYKYKGSIKEGFYPFRLPLPDFNLFYNVHIFKK